MKKILTACAIAAAALTAAPAFAQGYVGLGVGSSKISGFDTATVTGGNTNKSQVKIFGGFQFTPNWGAELQYSDLGKRDVINAGVAAGSITTSQFSIAGTGTLPLNSGFSLLGKLGVSANRINGSALLSNSNKTSALIGVGASYSITPALSVRVEYEDFGKVATVAANGSSVRVNAYSISLKYGF
jgi:OOP family OmpA-OmpF porin